MLDSERHHEIVFKSVGAESVGQGQWTLRGNLTLRGQTRRILGEDDLESPSDPTAWHLKALAAKGRPITLAIFPHADHGIYEFETEPDGERVNTRNADGYFVMMRDFARDGRLNGPYGASVVTSQKLPR